MTRTSHVRKALLGFLVLCFTFSQSLIAQSLSPSDDALVNTAFPTVNFGNLPYLEAGGTSRTYVRFDLSSLPAGFLLPAGSQVNLILWLNRIGVAGGNAIRISTVGAAWSEGVITSASAPPDAAVVLP